MPLSQVDFSEFYIDSFNLWEKNWMLLTSGDFEKKDFNTMTVAWGSFGIMWNKPFVQVVVRPTRHTYSFMEKYSTFTLTSFPEIFRKDLQLLGTKSGRDGNKIAETNLTPTNSHIIKAPTFLEAELSIECKKTYYDDLKCENFLNANIEKLYPKKDYHRIYFGEIVGIWK